MKVLLLFLIPLHFGLCLAQADMGEPLNTALIPSNLLPQNLKGVYVDQKVGKQIPLDLTFYDELGHPIRLAQIAGGKPVLLTLSYFKCPGLCSIVLNGVVQAISQIPQKLGKDFQVLTVSISPKERFTLARAKKRSYLARYGVTAQSDDEPGWRMLTGEEDSIRSLARAVGFHYLYDARYDEYSHPSVIMVLTPEGKISRYFFGIRYSPEELSKALQVASQSRVGPKVAAILLYCFHYDPLTGKWSLRILNLLRIAGALTALTVAAAIGFGFWKERAA